MSILDKFIILFESKGADKVKRNQDDLKKSSDNLEKSFKKNQEASHKAELNFSALTKKLAALGTAMLGASAISSNLSSAFDYTKQLDFSSRSLGINIKDLDVWSNAVKKYGGTAESFSASIGNLANKLHTSGQVALETLPIFANTLQKMGRAAAFKYGAVLGLDKSTINLLRQGRQEVESLIKAQEKLGTVTEKDAIAARKFNEAWIDASQALRRSFLDLETLALPTLTKVLKNITDQIVENREFFKKTGRIRVTGLLDKKSDNAEKSTTIEKIKESYRHLIETHRPNIQNISNNTNINKNSLPDVKITLDSFNRALGAIANTPMSLISNTNPGGYLMSNNNVTINNDQITIETQATNSEDIAQNFTEMMTRQLRQANNTFDDGLKI